MSGRYDAFEGDEPRGRGFLAGVASAACTLLILAIVAALLGGFVYTMPGPKARHGGDTNVVLRKGAGIQEIASTLQDAGVVGSAPLFMAAVQLSGARHRLKAGEYDFPSRASLMAVIGRIRRGEIVHHHVTVPEGLTSQQTIDVLTHTDVLTGQVPTPPEGAILPETYDVVRGEERAAVLQRMMDARDKLLAQLWAKRKPGLPFQTPDQAVTLASIVEKETALAAERPRVAAVYVNRLREGIRLEADPTLIYGLNGGNPLGRGLLKSELGEPGPYNTYLNAGLPPTPIGNPGRASLAAVLDPPDTKDLYFVANGAGGHAFAATYEDHLKNVARWRQVEHDKATPPTGTGVSAPAENDNAEAAKPADATALRGAKK